jgi:glycosyltransferase involved in cell wall biosynthesis
MPWSDLVVLSHLRWAFVWQRPQHLISRLSADQPTWFVEEPIVTHVDKPTLRCNDHGNITQVWLEIPGPERHCDFGAEGTECYLDELKKLLGWSPRRAVWLYTPMALDFAQGLDPSFMVYDVMDDLASFKDAPALLRTRQDRALNDADVVFAGGRSLHRGIIERRPDAHLFPSGVEMEHYLGARALRKPRTRPVAGFVGVIDERLDAELVAGLAAELPEWDIEVVGPVCKIDPASLPQAPNIHYPGSKSYQELPQVMAGFDVAIMPFAINEATRSISPTKTLEYLAAGLPVVSTPVPDVVADYGDVVGIATDAVDFGRQCQEALSCDRDQLNTKVWPILRRQHWDAIAARMGALLRPASVTVGALATDAEETA